MGHKAQLLAVGENFRQIAALMSAVVNLSCLDNSICADELASKEDLSIWGFDDPVRSAHTYIRLLAGTCIGLGQDISALLDSNRQSMLGTFPLSRSLVEAGSRLFVLSNPDWTLEERVGGYLAFVRRELNQRQAQIEQQFDYDGINEFDSEVTGEQLLREAGADNKAHLRSIDTFFQKHPDLEVNQPKEVDSVKAVFTSTAQRHTSLPSNLAEALAISTYSDLSSISHSYPRGLGSLTDNKLGVFAVSTKQVATALDPALDCWLTGFERAALMFGWPYHSPNPLALSTQSDLSRLRGLL